MGATIVKLNGKGTPQKRKRQARGAPIHAHGTARWVERLEHREGDSGYREGRIEIYNAKGREFGWREYEIVEWTDGDQVTGFQLSYRDKKDIAHAHDLGVDLSHCDCEWGTYQDGPCKHLVAMSLLLGRPLPYRSAS